MVLKLILLSKLMWDHSTKSLADFSTQNSLPLSFSQSLGLVCYLALAHKTLGQGSIPAYRDQRPGPLHASLAFLMADMKL